MTIKTYSARQTQQFGQEFAKNLVGGGARLPARQIVCLYGDLGAGKTTLVQGIARGLGIKNRIVSPTFILARRYKIHDSRFKTQEYLWHIDLYRLNDTGEAKAIGIEELLADTTSILLIEWPEKIESLLPKNHWNIKLQATGKNCREILYEAVH